LNSENNHSSKNLLTNTHSNTNKIIEKELENTETSQNSL